jgi:ADP-ribosylglycohydrolase
MFGAIAGDIIGSVYEHRPLKVKNFALFDRHSRFTDDSVLTVAVADAILNKRTYIDSILGYARNYPDAGYGGSFRSWMTLDAPKPYNSWGNGAAMRVSPVGYLYDTAADVLSEAGKTASISHNHPEGIKGAQAVALSIFLARSGMDKESLRNEIGKRFGYDLVRTVNEIRPGYGFDVSCQGSVPESIICFLDSDSWEDAVRNAVSLGGDSDTLACISGSIAEAFYGLPPDNVISETLIRLPDDFKTVIDQFYCRLKS